MKILKWIKQLITPKTVLARQILTDDDVVKAFTAAYKNIHRALAKNGYGADISTLEILGDITEEYNELIEAIRSGNKTKIRAELLDVATGALWGVASIDAGAIQ